MWWHRDRAFPAPFPCRMRRAAGVPLSARATAGAPGASWNRERPPVFPPHQVTPASPCSPPPGASVQRRLGACTCPLSPPRPDIGWRPPRGLRALRRGRRAPGASIQSRPIALPAVSPLEILVNGPSFCADSGAVVTASVAARLDAAAARYGIAPSTLARDALERGLPLMLDARRRRGGTQAGTQTDK